MSKFSRHSFGIERKMKDSLVNEPREGMKISQVVGVLEIHTYRERERERGTKDISRLLYELGK